MREYLISFFVYDKKLVINCKYYKYVIFNENIDNKI